MESSNIMSSKMFSRILIIFHALVIALCLSQTQEKKNTGELILSVHDDQKKQYLTQDFNICNFPRVFAIYGRTVDDESKILQIKIRRIKMHKATYNYGYEVNMHNLFHHQMQDSDEITYGCYGFTNPYGNLTAIFYVSDGWGYRVVHPEEDVKLFSYKVKKNGQELFQHGTVLIPWKDIPFPLSCGGFEEYSTRDDHRIIFAVEKKKSEEPIVEKVYGPWPTGSPGPNGPWPGDPDYVPRVRK